MNSTLVRKMLPMSSLTLKTQFGIHHSITGPLTSHLHLMIMVTEEIKIWSSEILSSMESTATIWFKPTKKTPYGTHHLTTGLSTNHHHHTTMDSLLTRILDKILSLMDMLFTTPKRVNQETWPKSSHFRTKRTSQAASWLRRTMPTTAHSSLLRRNERNAILYLSDT